MPLYLNDRKGSVVRAAFVGVVIKIHTAFNRRQITFDMGGYN